MRIGIRAHDMEHAPIEELAKNISMKGFCCTQLALPKAIDAFNVKPEAMTPGMALYLKQIFQENKVDIAVLGCYHNLANPNEEERNKTIDVYKTHIRFASLLGCGMVGTETGAVNREYKTEPANFTEAALEIFIENLKIVVNYAEKMGVIVGIEPVCRHIMNTIERTYQVLNAVNSPNLQVILDPVNLLNIENYHRQDDIIKGAFQLFNKDIAAIHAKDFQIIDQRLVEEASNQNGMFHSEVLLKMVKQYKPFIHVLLENTIPENAMSAKKYFQDLYANIIVD